MKTNCILFNFGRIQFRRVNLKKIKISFYDFQTRDARTFQETDYPNFVIENALLTNLQYRKVDFTLLNTFS